MPDELSQVDDENLSELETLHAAIRGEKGVAGESCFGLSPFFFSFC